MCGLCSRWAGKSCEEEGHVGPEDGETREGGTGISGEPGQHELAEPGAVDGSEDQDRSRAPLIHINLKLSLTLHLSYNSVSSTNKLTCC